LNGGWVPDFIIRRRIRKLIQQRLDEETMHGGQPDYTAGILQAMRSGPVAIHTEAANEQHYELPPPFFREVLGSQMKYSCCYWDDHTKTLDMAEEAALSLTIQRAGLQDGMRILELGCGWGSLTLAMARRFPDARITAVSNSAPQRQYIQNRCVAEGIDNVRIITADMNEFTPDKQYDRVVSVEMFEHMRNWETLLQRIHSWLKPDGKLFIHIFTHKRFTYFYEYKDETDWMSKYFFTGGIMPSESLMSELNNPFRIEEQWTWSGTHYQKTAEEWLKNMTRSRGDVLPVLEETYGRSELKKWWVYWRVFFMSCAELWGYNGGKEWTVSHYLLSKNSQV